MEQIELGNVIEEAIAKFSRNRIGDKPPVFLMIPSSLRTVPWRDRSIKELVRVFLYESLLTSNPDATLEISLRRRAELKDLDPLVGLNPSYWLQLRISGRGLKMFEKLAQELCYDVGYRCEEWITIEDSGRTTERTVAGERGCSSGRASPVPPIDIDRPDEAVLAEVDRLRERLCHMGRGKTMRFAVFAAFERPHVKIILCLESSKSVHRCDLLFPVTEAALASLMLGG
jgi:hypothetical protein